MLDRVCRSREQAGPDGAKFGVSSGGPDADVKQERERECGFGRGFGRERRRDAEHRHEERTAFAVAVTSRSIDRIAASVVSARVSAAVIIPASVFAHVPPL